MGPRLFGIAAREAPVAAVIRRGPSAWCRVYRWDLSAGELEPGAWLHGTIYPQRSDLSPDGRWLCAFILKGNATWALGSTYVSISRLPSLSSVAAWATDGTWTRGFHFVDPANDAELGPPDHGDLAVVGRDHGLAATRPLIYAVERRGGWSETADSPPKDPADPWDERRAEDVVMVRARPHATGTELLVSGRHAAFRSFAPSSGGARYELSVDLQRTPLDGVQWADWSADGRLLVATDDGQLQIRTPPFDEDAVAWQADVSAERPPAEQLAHDG